MDIADCYRVLGLTSVASAQEIKSSYRRLARQWHPDVNPDNQHAHDMFIRVTEAYKVLLTVAPQSSPSTSTAAPYSGSTRPPSQTSPSGRSPSTPSPPPSASAQGRSPQPKQAQPRPAQPHAARSTPDRAPSSTVGAASNQARSAPQPDPAYQIKLRAYEQLQELLQMKRYPRAIALIEALSQKMPDDAEIRQWQAIIYQRWGRQLIAERRYNQAKAYLKKAYSTDPNNKSLLAEIERDLHTIKMSV